MQAKIRSSTRRSWRFGRLAGLALLTSVIAVSVSAADRPAVAQDVACAGECTARGYASEYCDNVCRVPPARARPDEVTDWSCMSACSGQGGKYGECKPRCRVR